MKMELREKDTGITPGKVQRFEVTENDVYDHIDTFFDSSMFTEMKIIK